MHWKWYEDFNIFWKFWIGKFSILGYIIIYLFILSILIFRFVTSFALLSLHFLVAFIYLSKRIYICHTHILYVVDFIPEMKVIIIILYVQIFITGYNIGLFTHISIKHYVFVCFCIRGKKTTKWFNFVLTCKTL